MFETLTNLGNQFFGIERFGDIVITFQVEAFQTVDLFRPVGEEEDQYVAVLLADGRVSLCGNNPLFAKISPKFSKNS